MEEKEYYTEDELMEQVEKMVEATSELEKIAELQERIDKIKK